MKDFNCSDLCLFEFMYLIRLFGVGFEFVYFACLMLFYLQSNYKATPTSLYDLTALLIHHNLISLDDLSPHVSQIK